ncbi:MAG: DNA polymerase I [Gammaproteobacteria bacterium]|nr:DNA polymerase I [Gammaproteobacteria bacterium]
MREDKPLLLVDGSSYLFRAYHALPDLVTRDGFPTGAVRGVIGMLRKLAKDYEGSPIAVVFDAGGKNFRDEMYPEYKANRPPMRDDLRQQIKPIHHIIEAMGLPLLVVPGVEADDVIGTLATEATASKRATVVSTSDKDMAQLVSDHVTLVNTMTDTVLDRDGVEAKYGVPPELIVDYLALMGDAIDNIPGVPKVGPKTASKWLNAYGSLDAVVVHADEIKGKVGENLRDSVDQLPLSRALTTIKCDVDLDVSVGDLVPRPVDEDALRTLFEKYEFKIWMEEMGVAADRGAGPVAGEVEIVADLATLDRWVQAITDAGRMALTTKTTTADYMDADLVGFALAIEPGHAAYVPVGHDYVGAPDQLPVEEVLARLTPVLGDKTIAKIGQNLKYDLSVLARFDVTLRGLRFDTMLESYVIDSVGARRHALDALAAKYLGVTTIDYASIAGKGTKALSFNEVPLEQGAAFAAQEADVTLKLHEYLWPKLESEPGLLSVFQDIELPLVSVLSRVERAGALVDAGLLAEHGNELAQSMEGLTEQAYTLAGQTFNLGSPKQLQEILFDKLGLPVLGKTPKGQPSTAEHVLEDLALDYELPKVILEYRSLSKLKSTYTDTLPKQINATTGRIHTSYHQAVAATGRLSSADPNLQNIPIRTEQGRRIRRAFVAPPGKSLVAADYSQIELRIMAHLSEDAGLLGAFADNLDVHRATAAEVFGTTLAEVSGDQRRSAKTINFGLIYGMSAFGLGRNLGVTRNVAQEYIDRYFTRFPGVRAYMERIRAGAHERGYVETVFGRRLFLPEINARNAPRRQAAERAAINAPMQGTAADIIKRAMIAVDAWLQASALDASMIMQVHDELVFEVAESDVDALVRGVRKHMVAAADLRLDLVVDVGIGSNWDEAH